MQVAVTVGVLGVVGNRGSLPSSASLGSCLGDDGPKTSKLVPPVGPSLFEAELERGLRQQLQVALLQCRPCGKSPAHPIASHCKPAMLGTGFLSPRTLYSFLSWSLPCPHWVPFTLPSSLCGYQQASFSEIPFWSH